MYLFIYLFICLPREALGPVIIYGEGGKMGGGVKGILEWLEGGLIIFIKEIGGHPF